jgi:hypothetical protein
LKKNELNQLGQAVALEHSTTILKESTEQSIGEMFRLLLAATQVYMWQNI